jgi:hypothetical protein
MNEMKNRPYDHRNKAKHQQEKRCKSNTPMLNLGEPILENYRFF